MFLRLLGLLLLSLLYGCESLSMSHLSSEASPSAQTKPTLTSLSKPPRLSPSNLSDRMVIPKENEEVHVDTTEEAEPFPTVYFPFNSWEITPEVKERLDATAKWMTHFSRYELTIEGHTDIRGSESYNMVLGVKRAKAVKEYLASLGIPRTRLATISYGNILVLCDVDDENSCHQYNRRADLLLE